MQSIDIKLQPSKTAAWVLGALWVLSSSAVVLTPFNWFIKFIVWGIVSFYAYRLLQQAVLLKTPEALRAIKIHEGRVTIHTQTESHHVMVLGESLVTTMVSILRLQEHATKKFRTYIIFKDATPEYRQLTVALRYLTSPS